MPDPRNLAAIARRLGSSGIRWKTLGFVQLLEGAKEDFRKTYTEEPGNNYSCAFLSQSGRSLSLSFKIMEGKLSKFEAGGSFPGNRESLEFYLRSVNGELVLSFSGYFVKAAELADSGFAASDIYYRTGRLFLEHVLQEDGEREQLVRAHFYGRTGSPIMLQELLPFRDNEELFLETAKLVEVSSALHPGGDASNPMFRSTLSLSKKGGLYSLAYSFRAAGSAGADFDDLVLEKFLLAMKRTVSEEILYVSDFRRL